MRRACESRGGVPDSRYRPQSLKMTSAADEFGRRTPILEVLMRSSLALPLATAALVVVVLPRGVAAQDISSCARANEYAQANNIGDALFQNGLCQNALSALWLDGLLDAVNIPVAGVQPSDGVIEGAFGVNVLTINHGSTVTTFTSGTGEAASPIAALGGIAGLAASFGVRQQAAGGARTEDIPLDRRTAATLERTEDGTCKMTTATDDGVMVQEGDDCDQVTEVGRALFEIIKGYFAN